MTTAEDRRKAPSYEKRESLFALGRILATPGALDACQVAEVDPRQYLMRHVAGDWGDLGPEDKAANDTALTTGTRIFSAYTLPTTERLWIITEADRSATTLLLPIEY